MNLIQHLGLCHCNKASEILLLLYLIVSAESHSLLVGLSTGSSRGL